MAGSTREVLVAGVGMIPFTKPGQNPPYDEMGSEAIRLALKDGGVTFDQVEKAYAGYVFGESCSGQRVIYKAGMTGIPIVNVNNNCSTGSTALFLARQAVESGAVECALAVGFEQMRPGAIARSSPTAPARSRTSTTPARSWSMSTCRWRCAISAARDRRT